MFQNRNSDFAVDSQAETISFAELLSAFSYALDITQGQPQGHCIRGCWIGMHVGRVIGLPEEQLWELYYTLLLKDLGCSSNAARICQLYLADDHSIKHDYKLIDGKLNVLRFVLARTGAHESLRTRVGALANIMINGGDIEKSMIETRCTRGADIARQLRFSEAVAEGIAALDEHWNGAGLPEGLKGEQIPVYARIALLSQVVDVFRMANGRGGACDEVARRSGEWFDPALCHGFAQVAEDPAFWEGLEAADLDQRILALEPPGQRQLVDEAYLDDIASAFGKVIDAKSPYTAGHSDRVGAIASAIADQLGYTPDHCRKLRRAAMLHDIGKLGVSNMILDKPGPLSQEEWKTMRAHAADTAEILGRIGAFREMAMIAASHHERLDGAGYPLGLDQLAISLDTRIITASDIYDALTADRPYRKAMPIDQALAVMRAEVGSAIDPRCFAALEALVAKADAAF